MTRRPQLSDWLALLGLVVFWGSSFSMTKVAVTHMDAAWVTALRLLAGGAILYVFAALSGYRIPRSPELWSWFAVLGVIGYAAPFFLISWGTQFVTSGLSGVLMGSIPLMAIVLAHVFLPDEKLNLMKTAGFILGFIGLIVVVGVNAFRGVSGEASALHGELAILFGCLCYAVHAILARRIPYSGTVEQSVAVCLTGSIASIVLAMFMAPEGPIASDPFAAYAAVAGLGLLPTGIATLIMYRLLRNCGVGFVALSNYLVPVFALAFGALTLGESLTVNVGVGLALILAGIAISRVPRTKTQEI